MPWGRRRREGSEVGDTSRVAKRGQNCFQVNGACHTHVDGEVSYERDFLRVLSGCKKSKAEDFRCTPSVAA